MQKNTTVRARCRWIWLFLHDSWTSAFFCYPGGVIDTYACVTDYVSNTKLDLGDKCVSHGSSRRPELMTLLVMSSPLTDWSIHSHCQTHLPPPSHCVIYECWPGLTQGGKVVCVHCVCVRDRDSKPGGQMKEERCWWRLRDLDLDTESPINCQTHVNSGLVHHRNTGLNSVVKLHKC